jgi:hypothetical protein
MGVLSSFSREIQAHVCYNKRGRDENYTVPSLCLVHLSANNLKGPIMRTDVVLSCRRPQRTILKRMAIIEGITVTALLDARLSTYPEHWRRTAADGVSL